MTDKIVEFKGKPKPIDPANVPQWLLAYATLIQEQKEDERPRNVVVIELFDQDEATSHNLWLAGPKMKGLELIGLLSMVKGAIEFDQYVDVSGDE